MAQSQERRSKYKQLNTELPNDIYKNLSALAEKQRISKQELNRRLIVEYITKCS